MINKYTKDESDESFDRWPTVSYYVMSDVDDINAPGNEWRYADDWPITADAISFYFHEDEVLSTDLPGNYDPITYTYDPTDPVHTIGGLNYLLFQGPKDQRPVENRDDVLIFSSDVLSEPFESTGPIKARLNVSSNCVDTDFTVKLSDVYPDGRSMIIADGLLRMRNRNGFDHWDFMTPGEIYEIEVDLWSSSYVWNTGHRIRVAISSSNSPRFLANPNTDKSIIQHYENPTYNTAQNTLYLDTDHPSCIILQNPNVSPDKPNITGPSKGKPNTEISFTFVSDDPEGDDIYYFIDWGDGNFEDWTGPYNSGEEVTLTHIWTKKDKFTISAKAKDSNGLWSKIEVSEINLPHNRVISNPLLQLFLKCFPVLERLLGLIR
jgi:hypothetical protein